MTSSRQRLSVEDLRALLANPTRVLHGLGLLKGAQRQTGGYVVLCPCHDERTPSCSVQRRGGAILFHCFACGACGDVFALIAAAKGIDARADFPRVLRVASELAGDYPQDAETSTSWSGSGVSASRDKRDYPDADEVANVLRGCIPVDQDRQVSGWLISRGLDPVAVARRGLALALPLGVPAPRWATVGGTPWASAGYRCIVPMVASGGQVRSVRACRVAKGAGPKRVAPAGHRASGLVMADLLAREWLASGVWPESAPTPARIVVAEGEPDYLTWATHAPQPPGHAVLGIVSGSWSAELAAAVPDDAEVVIWTDRDPAGERYARLIAASLAGRCAVLRGVMDP